ncbi:MAG: filamentous hemagglutinin N-terminal domain-containing protein [Burkholderiaceae bacterium]|uniref:Filamentous hemagglutinin N-terminal domain-containing protein n=1 Tax=Herminiimonas contaminans TaxID=1111140 RepID=A0ABS0EVK6_9BURK|nr:GLUG motif-containing protein [Herminiimonas contaminans]MBF8178856.1 filamentous hemagglutinin N-terminal domain-containing protein [Herminiimonas contaminans]MBX9798368.1 filamentous hemagglutinin N-terminal domain-containing protein [Burkholderiaceae bacterium]
MNHIYRLVWSALAQAWVAVAENARAHGKATRAGSLAAALGTMLIVPSAYAANAADATVTLGNGSVSTVGNTTTIKQNSQNLAIDWVGLSTAANEALIFNQPNSSAIALNRITGSSPSTLLGSLTANGQVFILNPNGVLFGAGAQVNVGGLVASALGMSNADLEAGRMVFALGGNTNGSVINKGKINAADGGYVALIAGTVRNEGEINAQLGTALLAAGNKVTLNINNGSLLGYSIDQGALNALAENKQLIQANGGQVLMSAKALNNLTTAVVNNSGLIEAKTLENRNGRIMLMGDMDVGTVNVAGTLDASAPTTGDGGFIETSAAHVKIADDALITTKAGNGNSGTWLIDPVDFTVAANGGDITGKTLSTQLANNGLVTIMNTQGASGTAGDINVNDAVSWSSNSVLELIAQRNINFNAAVTATGNTAGLKLTYAGDYKVKAPITLSGSNSTLNINGNNYTLIRSMSQLDLLDGYNAVTNTGTVRQLSGYYALAQDLDAAGTTYTRSLLGSTSSTTFLGTFAGMGHTISNLTINGTGGAGLFALIGAGSVVRDLGMVGGNIYGANGDVGAIAGRNTGGTIDNVYATGVTVGGTTRIGGLLGYLNGGTLSNSYANVTVASGNSSSGGLVGTNSGSISNSYAEGEVNGAGLVGGLVGTNNAGASITQSYASGNVIGSFGGSRAGGLVGLNSGSISYAYATGAVSADSLAGGLVAWNYPGGSISNAYASGNVTLVANPALSGTYAGGLVGFDSAPTNNAVWDSGSSGQVAYAAPNGSATNTTEVTSANRYQHSAYNVLGTWRETAAGSGVWVAYDGSNNPQWVMVEGSTRPFLYSEWSTTVGNAHQLQLMAANLSANYTLAKNIDLSTATGSNASGMWSTAGFASIGNSQAAFSGTLDGKNHKISNLRIIKPTSDNVGMFGVTAIGSKVQNVSLVSAAISGQDQVGGLIGYNRGEVSNVSVQGQVTGGISVGGLAGLNMGTINAAYGNVTVSSLAGFVGGLVGANGGRISNSYADGIVSGDRDVGGLVGSNYTDGIIDGSYAAGQVSVYQGGGGLAGSNRGSISNSYAVASVNGVAVTGGLVGVNDGTISNSYANGAVAAGAATGGFIGINNGTVNNSFWNSDTNSTGVVVGTNNGLTGISSAQAQQASTFVNAGWDMGTTGGSSTIWRIYDGLSGPLLRSFLTPITVSATTLSKTYDGSATTASSYTPIAGVTLNGSLVFTSSKNAGSYSSSAGTLQQGGLYSTQQGYDISYADASLTINKANLTVTAGSASKTYDGTTTASGTINVGTLAGAGDLVNSGGSLAFDDKNAGNGKTVIASGVTIKDGANNDVTDNYNISYVNNSTGSIAQANLTLHVTDVTKTYDGTNNAVAALAVQSGQLYGQDEVTASGFSFNNKDAGNNKTVSASGVTVNDGNNGNNYNVTVVDSSNSTINRAALTVTANDASKLFNNLAYVGGNGVTLNGLVHGETIADLQGALTYGGSAQGATGAGSYIISANGLSSSNYAVTFVDGALVIRPVVSAPSGAVPGELLAAYNTAIRNNSNDLPQGTDGKDEDLQIAAITPPKPNAADPSQATPRLSISACGMTLPPAANNGGC